MTNECMMEFRRIYQASASLTALIMGVQGGVFSFSAAGCNMMLCVGYIRSFGFLFMEFRRIYQASASLTALIMGVQGGVFSFSGFLAQNVLLSYTSTRRIVMLGGFLSSSGVILSFFANNIPLLIVTQSLLIGCGNALIIGPGLVLLGEYFDKHRSLATAITNTGANIGAIAVPPLIRFLLDEFGLSGVFLVYGALMLNIIVFGALLRPIDSYVKTPKVEVTMSGSNSDCLEESKLLKNGKIELIVAEPEVKITEPEVIMKPQEMKRLLSENDAYVKTKNGVKPEVKRLLSENDTEDTKTRQRTFSTSSRSYRDSPAFKYASTPDLSCLSVQDITSELEPEPTPEKQQSCCMAFVRKTIDLSLFRTARFYLLLSISAFGVLGGAMMGIYIPVLGKDLGLESYEATIILSANGAAGAVSRILVGFFADRGIMKRNHILSLALFIASLTGLLAPLYQGFPVLLAFSLVNGFFCALYFSLIPVIIVDFLGIEKLSKTFGFLQLVQGASIAIAHPVSGLLGDVTGTFTTAYIYFGVATLIGCLLLLFEPCARRFDERRMACGQKELTKQST